MKEKFRSERPFGKSSNLHLATPGRLLAQAMQVSKPASADDRAHVFLLGQDGGGGTLWGVRASTFKVER
jgi:hypothetical protein